MHSTQFLSNTIDDFRDYFNPNKDANDFNVKKVFEKAFYLVENQLNKNNILSKVAILLRCTLTV